MSYQQDGLIQAADYNTNLGLPSRVLYATGYSDRGYGQSVVTIPTVTPPDAITGELQQMVNHTEWADLRTALLAMANHQGTTVSLPGVGAFVTDQKVTYYSNIVDAITLLDTNRLNTADDAMTIYSNRTAPSDTYVGTWSTTLVHEFKVVFSTVDQARYFFNTGGAVRFTPTRVGGTVNTQNQFWTDLFNFYGTVEMKAHNTRSIYHRAVGVEGIGGNVGYYELPLWGGVWNSSNLLWSGKGDGTTYSFALYAAYGSNFAIYGATEDGMTGVNGDRGKTLRFRMIANDLSPVAMDGNHTFNISISKATTYMTVTSPSSYPIVTAMTGT